ncbi:hypothetical protein [Absidia glauca]|uniref:Major facilitator superfamily (MFS) profile domain-containing protein n=1 Tax=Absidia glauca TaxID=4829 RepID=A0A168S2X4_ABSGL|nr:hypothetical protein [Absidia glauca]
MKGCLQLGLWDARNSNCLQYWPNRSGNTEIPRTTWCQMSDLQMVEGSIDLQQQQRNPDAHPCPTCIDDNMNEQQEPRSSISPSKFPFHIFNLAKLRSQIFGGHSTFATRKVSLEKIFKLSGQKEQLQDQHRGINWLDPFYGCKGANQLPLSPSTGIQSFSRPLLLISKMLLVDLELFLSIEDGLLGDLQLPPFPVKSTQMVERCFQSSFASAIMSQETIQINEEKVSHLHSSEVPNYTTSSMEEAQLDTYSLPDDHDKEGAKSASLDENEGLWHNPKGWAVVGSTFLVNFFCFGVVFQWGNYQQLYLKIYGDQTDTFRISFVGTLASTVLLSSGVFITPVIQKIGYRGTIAIGAVLAPLGMVLASFATSLWHIYLSQGLLFGIGSGLCFAASIGLPAQYFTKNRSLATANIVLSMTNSALGVCGSGIGAVAISPMTDRLMSSLGYRYALRIEGAMGFGLLVLATILGFSKSRPGGSDGGKGSVFAIVDRSIISHDMIALMAFCTLVTFGYIGPFFLAPQYASFLGHGASDGAALVSIMSGMNSLSRIVMGFLADRLGKVNTMLTCSLLAGIFTSVLWQFSSSYGLYIAYCVLYGLTGGAFVSLLPVVIADIVGVKNIQRGIGMCYTISLFGNLLGSPIIGKLLQTYNWTCAIQFSGATTLGAALILIYLRMHRSKGKLLVII